MAKITKTYSVDQRIYEAFDQITDDKNINKSSFIEGCINKFLDDNNMGYIDKTFSSKTDPSYIVTIKRSDDTFHYLNDGSKIPIILFMQMYREVEQVNPAVFFEKSADNRIENYKQEINHYLSKTGLDGADKINS